MRNKKLKTMRERNTVEPGLVVIREASSSNMDTWLSDCYGDSQSDIAKLFTDHNLCLNLWLRGRQTEKNGSRLTYTVEISNKQGAWKTKFSDSIDNHNKDIRPTVYDLLTCWNCDQSCGGYSFEDFCSELYSDAHLSDYPKVVESYQACQAAYHKALIILGAVGLELLEQIN